MAKLTVAEIKKKIVALEAKAARLVEEETKASVGRVRSLMNDLGVTLEHLSSAVVRKSLAVKKAVVGKKPATAKRTSKGVAKYRDPKTGATWSGFGRAPGWIAGATNRDAFLVSKGRDSESEAGAKASAAKKRPVAKKASAKKAAKTSVKRAVPVAKKAASKAAAPATPTKKPSIKAAASKAAAKKAAKKKVASGGAAHPPVAADSSGTSAT